MKIFQEKNYMRVAAKLLLLSLPVLASGQQCPPVGSRVVLAVDQSGSIKPEQRAQWRPAALQLASCVGAGGKLQIFGVTANTANEAPILSLGFPVLTSHTMAGIRRFMTLRDDFNAQAKSAIHSALEHADSGTATDLFGVITRAGHDGSPGLLGIFSDGLESLDPDLERLAIRDKEVPQLVRSVIQKRHWDSSTLSGTEVYIILPNGGRQIGPNSRAQLELFYRALVKALGGNLARFDNYL
jgi:hypothetical protein